MSFGSLAVFIFEIWIESGRLSEVSGDVLMSRDSGEWLDNVDDTLLKQLQNVSNTFHPQYLAVNLPVHHYGIHNSGGPPTSAASIMVDGEIHG